MHVVYFPPTCFTPHLFGPAAVPAHLLSPDKDTVRDEELSWVEYFEKLRLAQLAVRDMRGWPLFKEVFCLSAVTGEGLVDLKVFFALYTVGSVSNGLLRIQIHFQI